MTTEKIYTARPQEPIAPFPYHVEEITYKTKTPGVVLAGT